MQCLHIQPAQKHGQQQCVECDSRAGVAANAVERPALCVPDAPTDHLQVLPEWLFSIADAKRCAAADSFNLSQTTNMLTCTPNMPRSRP
jgi:hypothetical protein